ncbi:cytochrome c/c1 heme lyase [Nitzschia inconspicua]|uniref:Holocytochrome c-type synthase n=1 Tax=Nitzschia inconspicua TaxID=303405 RepID=A0A9K3PFI5_9STRA|nr:cytochrome c/c1 heme lyase [Nitzschia inconspicua]
MGSTTSKQRQELDSSSPPPSTDTRQSSTNLDEGQSKCPMHRSDGSYSYDWRKMFQAASVHGPQGKMPLSPEEREGILENTAAGDGCPVKHVASQTSPGCPMKDESRNSSSSSFPEYNVYSQPIDKTNHMPKGAKTQLPNPFQTKELSTDRVSSSIPKGGDTSSTWTYPSPQQFYNALTRKGKLNSQQIEEASEEDMASVVALHNNMNEKTWSKVVEWEHQTYDENATPKLLKFMGRPHDLSPKAMFKHYVLGHPLPYDRHDWTVLRDDGTTVRYVIDYYYDESRAQETERSGMPELNDRDGTPSLLVDVRPALDGLGHFFARTVKMPYRIVTKQTNYEPLPLKGTPEMTQQVQESIQVWKSIQESRKQQENRKQEEAEDDMSETSHLLNGLVEISDAQAREIARTFATAIRDCNKAKQRVENCVGEQECSRSSMDLTMCMGERICPVQHLSLVNILSAEDSDDGRIEASLETLTECVILKTAERRVARQQHPKLFQE